MNKIYVLKVAILILLVIGLSWYLSSVPKDEFCTGLVHRYYWAYCSDYLFP